MKYLYKYPQAAFPYADLVETNRRRNREEMEYELLDTGVFEGNRYFDVFVEYAKGDPEDILVRITVCNRGPEEAELHVLPTLWFRNDWSAWISRRVEKPELKKIEGPAGTNALEARHALLGTYTLYAEGMAPLLFTENETNNDRLFPEHPNASPYVKDGIHSFVVGGKKEAVNPALVGTKSAAHYRITVGAGQEQVIRLRLTAGTSPDPFGQDFDTRFALRRQEADTFYQQRLRRRLPGARQHRGLRPERAAADRRVPGASRRHGLDGPFLPEHAGYSHAVGPGAASL
jgi:hypothetical protein